MARIDSISDCFKTGDWSYYRKTQLALMRPYILGEDLSEISVGEQFTPVEGGMIAADENNPADQWYIAPEVFKRTYEPAE